MPVQQSIDAWTAWATGVLNRLGAPASPTNLATLWAWSRKESGSDPLNNGQIRNNPLATTQAALGSIPANLAGVQSFADISSSVGATTQTLQNGLYPDIINMLRNSVPGSRWSQAARYQLDTWAHGPNGPHGTGYSNFLGGATRAPAASTTSMVANSQADGSLLAQIGPWTVQGINPFGIIGSSISSAIGGAEQDFLSKLVWASLAALGAVLMLAGLVVLGFVAFQPIERPIRRAVGAVVGVAPQGKAARAATATAGAASAVESEPAPVEEPEYRAGGRRLELTPEARTRLRERMTRAS